MKKTKRKNPYLVSYLSLATICCLFVSIIFIYINYRNLRETQYQNYQKKIDMLIEDWENQLAQLKEIALRISVTSKYQPFYFKENKYNETILLDDFEQYSHYSALTDECFLYYGGDNIFHSEGNTVAVNVYLNSLSPEEAVKLTAALSTPEEDTNILTTDKKLFIIIPFRVYEGTVRSKAVICFAVKQSDLSERFQIITGGINGNLALFENEDVLYSNQETVPAEGMRNVLTASADDEIYAIRYLPDSEGFLVSSLLPMYLLLFLADVMMLLIIARFYARKSYSPILEMTERYRKQVELPEEVQCENALMEIEYMMNNMVKSNAEATLQITQKQDLLRRQILRMLINGNSTIDMPAYLDKLQIRLPGPYYFVISISFHHEEEVSEDFLTMLRGELEKISDENTHDYAYAINDTEKKHIYVICSIAEKLRREELTECICEVAESFSYMPTTGIGNTYQSISQLPASWLESMDNLHNNPHNPNTHSADTPPGYIFHSESLNRLLSVLSGGDEAAAQEELGRYTAQLEEKPASMLMQQYIFTTFISEINRLTRESHIQLSKQSISLIISAKNVKTFKEAASYLIHDFCENLNTLRLQAANDESYRIFEYVNSHFTEYDLSIEKAAADLYVSTAEVRQAILKHTGKLYKDYIITLRIDYAKTLLLTEDMTVAEICQKVGYGNVSYFIKLFKDTTGVTPAKYKNA